MRERETERETERERGEGGQTERDFCSVFVHIACLRLFVGVFPCSGRRHHTNIPNPAKLLSSNGIASSGSDQLLFERVGVGCSDLFMEISELGVMQVSVSNIHPEGESEVCKR